MKKKAIVALLVCLSVFGAACNKAPEKTEPTSTPTSGAVPTMEAEPTKAPEKDLSSTLVEEADSATEEDAVYFTSAIRYPKYEGKGADTLNEFVQSMTASFREYLPEAKDQALMDYHEYKDLEFFPFPEAEELTISVIAENDEWISFYKEQYSNTGGAHPSVFGKSYVVKRADASEVAVSEFLSKYSLTKEEVAEYAATKVREDLGEDAVMLFDAEGLRDTLLLIMDVNQWYLTENGLVIFANPYDIGPYALGIIECEISYEVLEQGLKNK